MEQNIELNLPNDISSCHELIRLLVAQNQEMAARLSEMEVQHKLLLDKVADLEARLN